jgi:hypothetical protein
LKGKNMLQFTDGTTINVDGPIRKIQLYDGLYVIGQGMCIPCENEKEVQELINELAAESEVEKEHKNV